MATKTNNSQTGRSITKRISNSHNLNTLSVNNVTQKNHSYVKKLAAYTTKSNIVSIVKKPSPKIEVAEHSIEELSHIPSNPDLSQKETASVKFCTDCGWKFRDSDKFCGECGIKRQ
eukprot:CAMPEP_0170549064 /NCGR_PEP_ID=MMETSP0211-20121228/7249_1 /TAXON_ID=311385 /ORGANISM="Pseudokeronopsis sp., Strain OXSARD2" /LENGTH=115 /DNA_ID=CAMNT_0010854869 /DNA_START=1976 /DNA_END=2323 /DNA_ORIENTATION=+